MFLYVLDMQFQKPKFRYAVYLENSKQQKHKEKPIICFADSYDISGDGAITFYQTAKSTDDKRFKIPTLTYPNKTWEACVLIVNNQYPVFNHSAPIMEVGNSAAPNMPPNQPNEYERNTIGASEQQENFHNMQSMPGVNNFNDYKQQKEEWLEQDIKIYLKNNDFFHVEEYISSIKNSHQYKQFKPTESEIMWCCSKMIRSKQVMVKKFYEPVIQKNMSIILPDIMKRQWDGKMVPILQVLQDKEETKNANAIDLSVWMVQNNIS